MRVATVFLCLMLAACGSIPRAAPSAGQIEAVETDDINRMIVPLTVEVAKASQGTSASGFPADWTTAGVVDPTRLSPGDVIEVNVWEPTDRPLIAGAGGDNGMITAVVGRDGTVRLPFTPPVKALGLRPDDVAADVAVAMGTMSADVQVAVRLLDPKGREVTVQGLVSRAGVYPIEASTLRLAGMLAQAGGATENPDSVRIDLTRKSNTYSVGLAELFDNPALDMPLRAGDRIVARPISDRYIVIGAATGQAELPFQGASFSLLQALARAGGLRDNDAAPDGIYLFRYETETVAARLLGAEPLPGFPVVGQRRPVVYRLDLTDPAAIFAARLFLMRHGDTIVVTNAPFTELRKLAGFFSTVVQPANDLSNLQNP